MMDVSHGVDNTQKHFKLNGALISDLLVNSPCNTFKIILLVIESQMIYAATI